MAKTAAICHATEGLQKAGGTLKSYLGSLQTFLEYVTKKGTRSHLPKIDPVTKDALSDLYKDLKG